jgi:hypothetical protein
LVSTPDLSQFGTFEAGVSADNAGVRSCRLQRTRQNAGDDTLVVALNVRDAQGVDTVNDAGAGKQTGNVNGRPAVKAPLPPAGCVIALGVGSGSRVDVSITAANIQQACDIATKVADIAEPKLPKG